jgi:hypothetical protein
MFDELKHLKPAPWLSKFDDVSDVLSSLRAEFVNQLYVYLRDREKEAADAATYFLEKIAVRGFHSGGARDKPLLIEATWSKLEYIEGGLHRGYYAGLVFRGANFVPGAIVGMRRRRDPEHIAWHMPNIYFGHRLEISASQDEPESPLSWRDYEFQIKNPLGQTSEWVSFSYPFDDKKLDEMRAEFAREGAKLLRDGRASDAIEPLRKSYIFSDRMLGIENPETLKAKSIWEEARNEAALAKLRFRPGVMLKVVAGAHAGKRGELFKLLLNHVHAYYIRAETGEEFQVADDQVEQAES